MRWIESTPTRGRELPSPLVAIPRGLAVPGDGVLNPVIVFAAVALFVNDHALKALWPGLISGKLSDFAGLMFFPILLVAAWELSTALVGRWRRPTSLPLVAATIVTATLFVAIKTAAGANSWFALSLGSIQWLGASALGWFAGVPPAAPVPVAVAQDPTDLVALVSLPIAMLVGSGRIHRERDQALRSPS